VSGALHAISKGTLDALAAAAKNGKLHRASLTMSVPPLVEDGRSSDVIAELEHLFEEGFTSAQIGRVLQMLAIERERAQRVADRVELVWTGPEIASNQSRHTSVVMNDLFAKATRSVLVSGYAVFQGKQVFAGLAKRMTELPDLRVRLFLNVGRAGSNLPEAQLVSAFAHQFRHHHWPGPQLPEIFYDPRSLAEGSGPKACLHAKCVVVDERYAFVTSANLTEAAQERNIEAGVVIHGRHLARALVAQFETLVESHALKRVPGL
jgi:phosphatidylserine/phosphatidylglycerophosphate/cardiolipin synthase-like enzyme